MLPIIFGFLAAVLFAWDYENQRVVTSMGMGWDMGPPMWPYRAVEIISFAINVPAYLISWPILKLFNFHSSALQYAVWFPAILALWWWVGRSIDFGLLGRRKYSHRKLIAVGLLVATVPLLFLVGHIGLGEYHWYAQYWAGHRPIFAIVFLHAAGEILWCLSLAAAFVGSALRILKQ